MPYASRPHPVLSPISNTLPAWASCRKPPKRCPTPQRFDATNPTHALFVHHAAALRAAVFGLRLRGGLLPPTLSFCPPLLPHRFSQAFHAALQIELTIDWVAPTSHSSSLQPSRWAFPRRPHSPRAAPSRSQRPRLGRPLNHQLVRARLIRIATAIPRNPPPNGGISAMPLIRFLEPHLASFCLHAAPCPSLPPSWQRMSGRGWRHSMGCPHPRRSRTVTACGRSLYRHPSALRRTPLSWVSSLASRRSVPTGCCLPCRRRVDQGDDGPACREPRHSDGFARDGGRPSLLSIPALARSLPPLPLHGSAPLPLRPSPARSAYRSSESASHLLLR